MVRTLGDLEDFCKWISNFVWNLFLWFFLDLTNCNGLFNDVWKKKLWCFT